MIRRFLTFMLAVPCSSVVAQDFAWSENTGWINVAPGLCEPFSARLVGGTHLAGYFWGENIGWINLGASYTCMPYAPGGFGVNVEPDGTLTGFAWAENVGWVNFGPYSSPIDPAAQARIDGGRFRGFAWAENIGWINFDSPTPVPGVYDAVDLNRDGSVSPDDIAEFVEAFVDDHPCADIDGDGSIADPDDIALFVELFTGSGDCG